MSNFNFFVVAIIMGDTNLAFPENPWFRKRSMINWIIYMDFTMVMLHNAPGSPVKRQPLLIIMMTNNPEKVKTSGVLEVCMGDHFMNYLVWKSLRLITHNHNYVTFRKSRGVDWDAFREDLRNENWNIIETIDDYDAVKIWEEMVLSVINKHMPFKTKRMRKKYSPWLNDKIFKLMKERDNAKKKAIASKNIDV